MKSQFLPFVATIAGVISLVLPHDVSAQKSGEMRRIGVLIVARPIPAGAPQPVMPPPGPLSNPFTYSLAKHGYVEGKNLKIERRFGEYEQLPAFARELEKLKVEVMGVWGTRGARIVQQVVKSTPLVIYSCDPYEHVKRLSHPGSNVTGTTCMTTELSPKRLELLHELLPRARRVAFFGDPKDAPLGWQLTRQAAKNLGISIEMISYDGRDDIPRALERVAQAKPDAVFVYPDAVLYGERAQLARFWLKHSLPSMTAFPEFTDAGGLMSYGAIYTEVFAFLGDQAGKILDGARPSDVPVERATRFHLVVNLKTAKALGVEVPKSLLLRADRVIK
jgi:ABC-type uncharacterized transport system substrate-binding protein